MKTKFFKKLSFVLVVAMVLSVFYPAAGAFAAAKKPTLNSTNKYLHLDVEGKNKYNFNINNKQSGWKYYWESADEDIAVVNSKNGVTTATGVGKTTVTVTITDKNKEVVTKLYAKVTVRDNIKTVKITNIPEGNKLAVGQENDFNRSFVTVSGSTKKTSAITRWTVDSDKATINDKGVFVANEAGEYTITARSFQSKAKYEDWKKDADTYAKYVLAEDTVKITVAASMVEAKQVDTDTVKVIFDSAMSDVDKNLNLYQLVGTTKVKQLIKEVKMSDDKKEAEVTVYVPFTQEATYVVSYPEMEDVSFVAASKKAEDVAYIKVDTTKAVVGKSTDVKVKLYNANDVDITDGDNLLSRVTMKAEEVPGVFFDGNAVTIFEKGKSVKITATYHSYKWDNTTGEEVGNLQAVGVIVGVDEDTTDITGLNAWTIVNDNDPKFEDVNHSIAAEDEGYRLYVKFNTKTGGKTDTVNSKDNEDNFVFESSNDSVLIIDDKGNLYPNEQGTVTIIVKYGEGDKKTAIGAIQLTVGPKAKATNLVLDTTGFTLSNVIDETKEVGLELKDQYGRSESFNSSDISVTKKAGTSNDFWSIDNDKVTFYSTDVAKGNYTIEIKVKDVSRFITINVVTSDDTNASRYALELGSNKADLKVEDGKVNKSMSIKLYGLASNGAKIEEVEFDGLSYKLVVDAPYVSGENWDYIYDQHNQDNNNLYSKTENGVNLFDGTNYTLVHATSDSPITKAPTGSYKVTAYKYMTDENDENGKWVPVGTTRFIVEDTQVLPTVTKYKTLVYDNVDSSQMSDVIRVVKDCFEIKLNGTELTEVHSVDYSGTDKSLYIRSITVRKYFEIEDTDGEDTEGTAYIDFKVSVNENIKQK